MHTCVTRTLTQAHTHIHMHTSTHSRWLLRAGPIGVEMDVKDPKWAPFVEKQCGAHLLNYCVTCP